MNYTDKIVYQSNYWYNDGLGKARIRDLSGAITSLRKSLQYNRENVTARNLLGLVYYARGEVAEALVEWIISKNLKTSGNPAGDYIRKIQQSQSELETINQAVKKFNQCLVYCEQGGEDLAVIQLKKVVAAHPSFLKAYQLLALLYLHTEQYAKARQVLRTARKLDTTDETTLRYIHEVAQMRDAKSRDVKGVSSESVSYKLGNETIIQPAANAFKGAASRIAAMNFLGGLLAGAAVIWFLIVPAVNEAKSREVNGQIREFSDQLTAYEAQISAQTKALDQYRANSEETQEAEATASGTRESYENLLAVSDQYESQGYTTEQMAELLSSVNRDSLGESGQALYDQLSSNIFLVICEQRFAEGIDGIESGDYQTAADALGEVVELMETYGDGGALYYLGMAYDELGDAESANEQFRRLLEILPDSGYAGMAREYLSEDAQAQSGEEAGDGEEEEESRTEESGGR